MCRSSFRRRRHRRRWPDHRGRRRHQRMWTQPQPQRRPRRGGCCSRGGPCAPPCHWARLLARSAQAAHSASPRAAGNHTTKRVARTTYRTTDTHDTGPSIVKSGRCKLGDGSNRGMELFQRSCWPAKGPMPEMRSVHSTAAEQLHGGDVAAARDRTRVRTPALMHWAFSAVCRAKVSFTGNHHNSGHFYSCSYGNHTLLTATFPRFVRPYRAMPGPTMMRA